MTESQNNPAHLIKAVIVLAIGAAVAYSASSGHGLTVSWHEDGQVPLVFLAGAASFVINWLAFIPAECYKTEHYFDLTGSITYITLIWATLLVGGHLRGSIPLRQWIVSGMVTVWALRLGVFLARRVNKAGKDGRFDELKKDSFRFFNVWTIQGLWVLFTAISTLIINCSSNDAPLSINDYVGYAIWALGFLIEAVADHQKTLFNSSSDNKGRWIDQGLWRYSRHPNYFGEITLWLGMAISGTGVYSNGEWIAFLSPVFVILLLTKVSGLPMLESRADEKWGHLVEYQQYKAATSVLIPLPRGSTEIPEDSAYKSMAEP